MLVLRIQVLGQQREVRRSGATVRLGTAEDAEIRETDAGWNAREAVLLHRGTEVELRREGGDGSLRLRVGDSVRLGRARLTLVGLMPLEEGAEEAGAAEASPVFGEYPEAALTARSAPFRLETVEETPRPGGAEGPAGKASSPPPVPRADAPARPEPATAREHPRETPPDVKPSEDADASRPRRPKGVVPPPRPRGPAFAHEDFGTEMVRQLRRAPFFVVSLALHVLVFFLLTIFQALGPVGRPHAHGGNLHAVIEAAERLEEREPDERLEALLPEPTLPDLPDPMLPDTAPVPPAQSDPGEALEPLEDREPAPYDLGLNPRISAVDAGSGRARTALSRKELTETYTKGSGISRAANVVRGQLGRGNGDEGKRLGALITGDLYVVEGTFDRIGKVLDALQLPYQSVTPAVVGASRDPELEKHKVVFWNCGEALPPDRLMVAARRLRTYVQKGGYLFTTDWSVGNLLPLAFPGYLATNGPTHPLPETTIDIEPAPGQAHNRLLRGVFHPGVQGRWWLEQSSFDIRVLRPRDVTVLIESQQLRKLYGRDPPVAVTFSYGRGRVLHVMGHYYQESGNLAGAISSQRLALNFVLERLDEDR